MIIDGNPLANIKDLRRVKAVMKDGQLFELDALLRRAPSGTALSGGQGRWGRQGRWGG